MKRIIILTYISFVWIVALMADPVTPSPQARKFSMTTRMFLQELKDGGFDPVKQEVRRRARRAALDPNVPKDILKPYRRSKNDGRFYVAPDTINGVAYVSAFITLEDNNNVSELENLGVRVQCKFQEGIITSDIPVDRISDVAALNSVKEISVARIMKPCTNHARMYTNVDDILTPSADALRVGVDNKYDGKNVLLGIIDTGIDFKHIAFKDKDGNSRLVGAYIWNGVEEHEYSINQIAAATTDDDTEDHGTHTASTAGGSSVIIDGSSVTVTEDHAKATYGGMAPGADLFLCGIKDYKENCVANSFHKICKYADDRHMPVVISNSYGSMVGTHNGKGSLQTILSQYFNDNNPNHICLFSTGNYAGNSKDNESGGVYVYGEGSESNPLSTILRENFYNNTDAGYAYSGMLAYAHARNLYTPLRCTIYVLDSSSGSILTSIPVSNSGIVSGIGDYYDGDLKVYFGEDYVVLYLDDEDILKTKSTHSMTMSEGSNYYISDYTLAFDIYPQTGNAAIDVWGMHTYFTNHLSTSEHTWIAGSDDVSVNDEATYLDVIPVGAYVTRIAGKDYKGENFHMISDKRYSIGDIAPFSSYATAEKSPTGKFYPWITAPGALSISAVNSYNSAGKYLKDNFDDKTYRVNNSRSYPYGTMEGTSMACPVVAGIVALWLQAANDKGLGLTTSDVKQIMAETAIKDEYVTSVNSTHFGNGKIDALAGLIKVLEKATASADKLFVTYLELKNGNLGRGIIDGTTLYGTLYIKNNDAVTAETDISIELEDLESPMANQTVPLSILIDPNSTEGYIFSFGNLRVNHHYVITVTHVGSEQLYHSSELLCKTGEEHEIHYSDYMVLNKPYIETNTSAFKDNEHTASDRINDVINLYLSNGIVAKKADLVGHSMGGILARLHVQYTDGGNENVHKVITVNTPHSGSPLGDLLGTFALKWGPNLDMAKNFKSEIIRKFYGYDSKDWHAVGDLGYDSDQTDEYLNNETVLDRMNNIPIHAIVTDVTGISTSDIEYLSSEDEKWLEFVRIAGKMGLNYIWSDNTDLVVSVQSQKGGLETPFISTIHDQWHVGSPNNKEVQDALISLLQEEVESSRFCKDGFRPINLVYENTSGSRTNERYSLVSEPSSTIKHASGVEPTVTALVNDNVITASMAGAEGYDYQLMLIQFGKDAYSMVSGMQIECEVPASFFGDATIYGIVRMEDKDILWSKTQVNIPTPRASRTSISTSALSIYYDESQPVSLTCIWSDGTETHVIPDDITFTDRLAYYEDGIVTGLHGGSGTATFTYQGLTCEAPFTVYNFGKDDDEESSQSVCSTITLKLSQTMTMTRQAFRGTLTVFNGNENAAMRDVKLTLQVTNKETGKVATSSDFEMHAESIDGFTGEVDLTSGWTLAGNATGTATVLFIPTKNAAPTEPVEWSFGGTLSYLDPFTGLTVTRDLYPVTLTVKPSPELDLTYFMQRDVYGDDPLTMDVVEPVKPAEFALLINNKGYGDATDVKMVTQQPEIIDNQKGLAINFEIISSQVNGADATLSFGQTISNDFGTIPAHSQMYAQWWLTSTLLGHFTEYDVEATHVTSYGNEDLSLLDKVTIHELIHGFDLSTNEQQLRAFLVNDLPDSEDLPDMLYFSNGETENVSIATSSVVERTSNTTCKLTIVPSAAGWNYGNLLDPTHGMATIKSIVRQSDGKEMAADNFWQTDRTLRDGNDWLYKNRLHFIDELTGTGTETYVITFNPIPNVVLEVESIEVVPEEGTVAVEPVETLAVTFSKPIEPETFTADDLTFSVQGAKQDASLIGISTADNKSFTLDMKAVTDQCPNGYYTLTVQTADITDNEGYQGKTGKQVGWIMYRGGLVQLLTSAWPEKSGSVSRSTDEGAGARLAEPSEKQEDTAQYGSTVTFTAQPAEGYEFSSWTLNGEEVSREATYTATALSDMDVVAYFTKKSYHVDIDAESENGSISGAGTGYYEYGSQLSLSAVPSEDFILKEWNVNGETVPAGNGTLNLTVNSDQTIKAVFEREYYHQSIVLAKGWNWVSSYLNESLDTEPMSKYANRIVGQFDELILDPQYGMVGGLERLSSGSAFKVEANRAFTSSFRGHLYNPEATPMQLHKGWNWIAYPYTEQLPTSTVIVNAEEGDYLVSQSGFTEFADGYWEGSLKELVPGSGYLYKSVSSKMLSFDFTSGGSTGSRSMSNLSSLSTENGDVDIYRYPNTMNMTIQICQEDNSLSTGDYNIYAMVGDELRGVSQKIGDNYYLTVYGDEPVEVSFAVESTTTGEVFVAPETLRFRDDVVGSRKSPYVLHIGGSTGIESWAADGRPMTVYSLEGILVSRDATLKTLKKLPKGVYIVNGHKCFIK